MMLFIKERIGHLFPPKENIPASLSIQQAEQLKARVHELEAELAQNQTTSAPKPTTQAGGTPASGSSSKTGRGWGGSLSRKILLPTLLIFLLVLVGFFAYSYLSSRSDNQTRKVEDSRQAENIFNSEIKRLSDFALGLAIDAANNPQIQAAFAERDREKLISLTLDSYLALDKQFNIPQYQYHLPPATSFLRLHSLEQYGDDLSSFRATVVQVNKTLQPVSGLEVGRGGLGLRGIEPVFYQGNHIGSVEYGLNIDEGLVTNLKQAYGHDWRIILTRDALSLATLKDISALKEGPTPDLLILASTAGSIYPDASVYKNVLNGERALTDVQTSQGLTYSITTIPLRDYSGKVIGAVDILIDQTGFIQAQNNRFIVLLIAALLALLVGAASLTTTTNRSLRSLGSLTKAAEAVERGDLNQQVTVGGRDEIGQLAHAFNTMTFQLRNLVGSLEQRVEERTHDLELATEVGRTITENIADTHQMLAKAAESIRTRFNLYYTQIYLVDPSGRTITLRAGTGEVGKQLLSRGHRLAIGPGSLNGRAVAEKRAVIVADTAQNADFLPNPLLPNTRSEMVVPLLLGGRVIGALNMQSEKPGMLSESNLPAFEALAGQLSVAIQNANLFAETEESRREMEANVRRGTELGWQNYLNGVDRGEQIGFVYSQNETVALADVQGAEPSQSLSIPITITGATVGAILTTEDEHELTSREREILETAAAQLGQHIEGLRLLAQAEEYRREAEQAAARLTREGWDSYLNSRDVVETGYVYDQNLVKPLAENVIDEARPSLKHALVVRDETIGQLEVADATTVPQDEAIDLVSQVATRLSQHIENLRLLEQTEQSRLDIQQGEARLSEALDIARLANWDYDVEKDIFTFNDHFYSIFHTTAAEVGGYQLSSAQYAQRFVHPEDAPLVGGEIGKALSSTDRFYTVALEHRVIYADGGVGYISVNVHVERDASGRIVRFYGANQDITERRMAQNTIAQRANQLETVAVVSSTASTVLDPDKLLQAVVDLTRERFDIYHAHIYLADSSWNTLLLASGAGEVGRQMVAAGHAIPLDAEHSLVARAARERNAIIVNDVRLESDFLPNPMLPETRAEMAVPMIVGDRLLGVFDVQSDVAGNFTEEDANIYTTLAAQVGVALQNARLYVEQSATVTQLRELDRLKSSFLANMSHELRTPLNSILGFTDVMLEELDGPLTVNMNNDLGLIQKNGRHLLHLINDVLDMAKIEAGKMNLSPEKFRVLDILEEVTNITSPLATEKSLALYIEPDSDQEVKITADRTRLRQVMINIINNAIKFTEVGRISLRVTTEAENILVAVRDTGIGIPTDKLEAIFQEFTQVDTSSTRKTGGTGLGLPISRRLVEMHGGRLWAESSGIPGDGSIFFVELPVVAQISEPIEKMEK